MKKAILVLGAPRSGTSVVSNIIHKLGVDFGDHACFVDPNVHTFNPIFFELQSLNDLNDEIFAQFSKRFIDFDWMPDDDDFGQQVVQKFQDKISAFIGESYSSDTIGLKDTRFCFTLPIWDAALNRLGFDVHYVFTQRLSNSVYASNKIQNKYSSATNFRLVAQSTLLAQHFLTGKRHLTVGYEDLLTDPNRIIARICDSLGLDRSLTNEARAVVRQELNHHKVSGAAPNFSYLRNVIDARPNSAEDCLQYREIVFAASYDKDQTITALGQSLKEREGMITQLNRSLTERDEHIASLQAEVQEHDETITSLTETIVDRDKQIVDLGQVVEAYRNSTCWKLTKPVRFVGHKLKRFNRILVLSGALLSNLKDLKNIFVKLNRKGLNHALHYLQLLQSEENVAQISKDRGITPELLRALVVLGTLFIRIKQWWFANTLRREYSELFASYLRSGTSALNNSALRHIRMHIDKPTGLFDMVDDSFAISGWCVDLDACAAAKVRIRVGNVTYQPQLRQREDVQRVFASICELPLDVGFSVAPLLSWGLHRIWVDLEGPNRTWIPVHRALLLCVPKILRWQRKHIPTYTAWNCIEQKRLKTELLDIMRHIDGMIHKPIFTVIIDTRQSQIGLEATLDALRKQIYPHYDFRVLNNADGMVPALLQQDAKPLQDTSLIDIAGDFIIFIEGGQYLSSNALYEFANALNQYPDLDLIYGDEDKLDSTGERFAPFYKPDWSPDYLESFNYIGFPSCFRTTIARSCFNGADQYDLVLRFTERTTKIFHVNKILGHQAERQVDDEALDGMVKQNIVALESRLSRTNRNGTVREHQLHRGCYDIELDLKRRPLVSVIIPTAGKTVTIGERQIDLITNIVNQIRNYSSYKNIEIIIVDNGDLSEAQRHILAGHACQLITYTEPVFNISKKLNLGATIASGEYLLLMNDDIEILNPSWIERMVEHFEKPHVGVVGAKLLYPDGRTQHVGVVHNYGNPDHVRRLFPGDEAGYYFSTCGVRNYMAVTGAVMMTLASLYRMVGGYSEALAISFNDIDFCLKVREKGFWIVYAPKVELTHMESQSREAVADMNEVRWYHMRWASYIVSDPYYNEQYLTVAPPTFTPCVNQRLL